APCSVPFFEAIISGLLNDSRGTDSVGLSPLSSLAVSASGQWELLDVLRVTSPGSWRTSLNVFSHGVQTVLNSDAFANSLRSQYDLSDKCLGCRNLLVC